MNVLQTQFLDISVKENAQEAGKKAQGGRDEVEVYDSVTHNVEFDANCQMIS